MEIGLMTSLGPSSRLSRTPVLPGRAAPKLGAQGREILEKVSLGPEFDGLLEQGVIHSQRIKKEVEIIPCCVADPV